MEKKARNNTPKLFTLFILSQAGIEVIKESEAQLWWAGKQLEETKLLSDYVGKNEKTTIIVKIQKVSIAWRFLCKSLTIGCLFSVRENYP